MHHNQQKQKKGTNEKDTYHAFVQNMASSIGSKSLWLYAILFFKK